MLEAPEWASSRVSASGVRHVALLMVLRDMSTLGDEPKTETARRLGISRWTLDRYLAELEQIEKEVERMRANG